MQLVLFSAALSGPAGAPIDCAAATMALACGQLPFSAACLAAEGAARRICAVQACFFASSLQLRKAATAPGMFSRLA